MRKKIQMKKKRILWTKEQEEIIQKMIKEAEEIGYIQGRDDAIKELIEDLKSRIFRGENGK